MAEKKIEKLRDLRPQIKNANAHTARGLGLLEDSIQRDGWIGAITVASDGETFDGSARLEVGAGAGFDDAIIVESDGTRPVIVKRTDIATADDPKAKRLGVEANRAAEINLSWDAGVLESLAEEGIALVDVGFRDEEWAAIAESVVEAPTFAPELHPTASGALVSEEDLEKMKAKLRDQLHREVQQRPFNCPHCGEQFYLNEDDLAKK